MANPSMETSLFKALPGYPFYPCKACHIDGHMVEGTACWGDHTVLERAQAMHPGLVLHQSSTDCRSAALTGKKDVEVPRVKSEYKRPAKPKTTPLLFVRPPYVPPPVITLEQQRLHSRSYSDLEDRMCKWPLYYEGEVQMYCAAPVEAPRKPYCECHTEMAKPPRNAIRGPYSPNKPSATRFR